MDAITLVKVGFGIFLALATVAVLFVDPRQPERWIVEGGSPGKWMFWRRDGTPRRFTKPIAVLFLLAVQVVLWVVVCST